MRRFGGRGGAMILTGAANTADIPTFNNATPVNATAMATVNTNATTMYNASHESVGTPWMQSETMQLHPSLRNATVDPQAYRQVIVQKAWEVAKASGQWIQRGRSWVWRNRYYIGLAVAYVVYKNYQVWNFDFETVPVKGNQEAFFQDLLDKYYSGDITNSDVVAEGMGKFADDVKFKLLLNNIFIQVEHEKNPAEDKNNKVHEVIGSPKNGGHASSYAWDTGVRLDVESEKHSAKLHEKKIAFAKEWLLRSFGAFGSSTTEGMIPSETEKAIDAVLAGRDHVTLPKDLFSPVELPGGYVGFRIVAKTEADHALSGNLVHICVISPTGKVLTGRTGVGKSPLPVVSPVVDKVNNVIGPRYWRMADMVNAASLEPDPKMKKEMATQMRHYAATTKLANTAYSQMPYAALTGGTYLQGAMQRAGVLAAGKGTQMAHHFYNKPEDYIDPERLAEWLENTGYTDVA